MSATSAGQRHSGPGLAPAALELVSDLSICRSIIENHGGILWANANVPRGAEFKFTVPAHPDATSDAYPVIGDPEAAFR
jgi:hypothetical protein